MWPLIFTYWLSFNSISFISFVLSGTETYLLRNLSSGSTVLLISSLSVISLLLDYICQLTPQVSATYSRHRRTWGKVRSRSWQHQCALFLLEHSHYSLVWWLCDLSSSENSSPWDLHPVVCRRTTLWSDPCWCAISLDYYHWSPMGS